MTAIYKPIGNFIREVKTRNTDLTAKELLGINVNKFFMPSVANIIGTDMTNYKIVQRNQFACNRMHVGRDYRIPVSLSYSDEPFMVSPAYDVFEIKDTEKLIPEYLMMWFYRAEFDRNAWFYTDADVRGGLNWKAFCEMQLPLPSPAKQKEIVAEYNTVQNRINLNKKLIQKLEETAQAIYKQWFVDGIDLENLPKGWRVGVLEDLSAYSNGRVSTEELFLDNYISTENMLQNKAGIMPANRLPAVGNAIRFKKGDILISNIRPYFKKIWLADCIGGCSNDVLCFTPKANIPSLYLYQALEKDNFFEYVMAGSKGTKMPRGDKKWIMNYPSTIPSDDLLEKFEKLVSAVQNDISHKKQENKKLSELKDLLLSKLATIED